MKRFLHSAILILAILVPGLSFAQSPGTPITSLPTALTGAGTEIFAIAQQGTSGQYSPAATCQIVSGVSWCGAGMTLAQIKTYTGGGGGGGGIGTIGINGSGIISFAGGPCSSSTCTFNVVWAGTSGGIPCFTSGSVLGSSSALAAGAFVVGGGAGACPSTVATINAATQISNILPAANGGAGQVQNTQSGPYTTLLTDANHEIICNNAAGCPFTINTALSWPSGVRTCISFFSPGSSGNITLTVSGGGTLTLQTTGTAAPHVMQPNNQGNACLEGSFSWYLYGAGFSS